MPMSQENIASVLPKDQLLRIINRLKRKVKNHPTMQQLFDDYGVSEEEIDLIPMAFKNLDVSAQTDHGIIYLNTNLLNDGDYLDDAHYLVHEITHFFQQTTGDGPTQGANDGDYLTNPYEQEGFQRQTEYISMEDGPQAAEDYIETVLDHHDETNKKEREYKKEHLLSIAKDETKVEKLIRCYIKNGASRKEALQLLACDDNKIDSMYRNVFGDKYGM